MKQMDTILKAVGIKTKECRLEEKAGAGLFPPPAKKSQQEAGGETQEEENTVQEEDGAGSGHWSWAPTASSSLNSGHLSSVPADTSRDGEVAAGAGTD